MTQYVDFEKVGADVQAAARKIREAEQSLRNAAAALGRSPQALAFNHDCEGLVERGVVLHVDDLVREFVEHQACQRRIRIVDESGKQRIVEPAERRVGGHAVDHHVIALRAQVVGVLFGRPLRVVPAVGDAAGDRKARLHGLQGEFRRRHHVPYRVGAVELGVAAIGTIVRQLEVPRCELADRRRGLQALLQGRRRVRIRQHLVHTPCAGCQIEMPADRLRVVRQRAAAGQRQRAKQGK